jgi:hypothetical protein
VRDVYRLAFDIRGKAFTRDRRVRGAPSRCPVGVDRASVAVPDP